MTSHRLLALRCLAGLIDLALVVLLVSAVPFGAEIGIRLHVGLCVLTCAIILIIGGAGLAQWGRVGPGKWLLRLRLNGGGCALCREVRRWWPLLGIGFVFLGLGLLEGEGFSLPPVVDAGLLLLVSVGIVGTHGLPIWRGDEFPHNRATGFTVTRH